MEGVCRPITAKAQAVRAARCLLFGSYGKELPVNLKEIAATFDIHIVAANTRPLDAVLVRTKPRGAIVYVNARHAPTRCRFSVAHELGHYFLYHYASDKTWTKRYESAANCFAAELLMPTPVVVSLWAEVARRENPRCRVCAVAQRLAVSPRAAAIRVGTLGLVESGTAI